MNDDQRNRLLVLFNLDDNSLTTYGWQQYQGKVSIASGGLFGEGYMNGPRVAKDIVPYQEMILSSLLLVKSLDSLAVQFFC